MAPIRKRWSAGARAARKGGRAHQPGSVSTRIMALFRAAPDCVISSGMLCAELGSSGSAFEVPLTKLVVDGLLIELKAGFCLATVQNRARLAAELAPAPVQASAAAPLGDLARRIVARAHDLRRHGRIDSAVDLLERAGLQCRCPRVAANFQVLAALFAFGGEGYRDMPRRALRREPLEAVA